MPRDLEGFDASIAEERRHAVIRVVRWIASMTRFYDDFFGRPIRKAGYTPVRFWFQGTSVELSNEEVAYIVQTPTLPLEDVVKNTKLKEYVIHELKRHTTI